MAQEEPPLGDGSQSVSVRALPAPLASTSSSETSSQTLRSWDCRVLPSMHLVLGKVTKVGDVMTPTKSKPFRFLVLGLPTKKSKGKSKGTKIAKTFDRALVLWRSNSARNDGTLKTDAVKKEFETKCKFVLAHTSVGCLVCVGQTFHE